MSDEKGGTSWDRVTAVSGILVGLLAFAVSGYMAFLQRQQANAAVWPRVRLAATAEKGLGFQLENKGVGPAKIKYVEVRLDGASVKTWSELFDRVLNVHVFEGGRAAKHVPDVVGMEDSVGVYKFTYSDIVNSTLSAGESRPVVTIPFPAVQSKHHDKLELIRAALPRIATTICYCSVFEECWELVDEVRADTREVKSCPPSDGPKAFTE